MRVRRATPEDRPALCVTAMRAVADDPSMRWLYPQDDAFFAPGGDELRPAPSSVHPTEWNGSRFSAR